MKSASTAEITEFILYDAVGGSRSKPLARVKYKDDNDAFQEFDDIENFSLSFTNENVDYGKFKSIPPTASHNASINNAEEKYSPDAGGAFDGVLVRNREVRPELGYTVLDSVTSTYSHTLTDNLNLYHTKINGSQVEIDITPATSFDILQGVTDDWTLYGSGFYGGGTYTPSGYYLTNIINPGDITPQELQYIQLNSNSTNLSVYYRTGNTDLEVNNASFIYLGATMLGANYFDLYGIDAYKIQIVITFDITAWTDTDNFSNLQIGYQDFQNFDEYFKQGIFYMDNPGFSSQYGNYKASYTGRDGFRKGLETSVTLPDYTSSTDVSNIIRDAADRAGVPHNDGSELITDTGFTVTIDNDDNFKNVRALDVFEECIQYLNYKQFDANGLTNYRLEFTENGDMQLVLKSNVTTTADYQIHNRDSMLNISKRFISDNLLQRATALSKEHPTDEEIQLATANYTTSGAKNLSWSNEAIYKRITLTEGAGNNAVFDLTDTNNTNIDFTITEASTASVIDITVTINGAELQSSPPDAVGENIVFTNAESFDGITHKAINRLLQSDAEAKGFTSSLADRYGDPSFKSTVRIPCNPLLELGDRVLLWEKYTYSNTIYRIDKISIEFSASNASMYQTLELTDLGIDLDNYNWDRNNIENGGGIPGIDDLKWDIGLVWDQGFGPTVTEDTTDYSNTKQVEFS